MVHQHEWLLRALHVLGKASEPVLITAHEHLLGSLWLLGFRPPNEEVRHVLFGLDPAADRCRPLVSRGILGGAYPKPARITRSPIQASAGSLFKRTVRPTAGLTRCPLRPLPPRSPRDLLDDDGSALRGANRPDYEEVPRLARGGQVDDVARWQTSRLLRNQRDALTLSSSSVAGPERSLLLSSEVPGPCGHSPIVAYWTPTVSPQARLGR